MSRSWELSSSHQRFLVALLAAIGVTMVYWWPMWAGAGMVGGDVSDYFYPQKVYLARALERGDVPLWNNLVQLGYPFVADSQIAMWYPTTIPLYATLPVATAFHVNILIHYVLAFLFTWAYGRAVGLRQGGALLAALALTYGWFPPRLSVEWAVTTGCYFPGVLWAVEQWLRTGRRRWLGGLVVLLTLQLLAGHFSLAFITHVLLAFYTTLRLTLARRRTDAVSGWKPLVAVLAVQVVAFPMAACQLAPTWELRQQSQRGGLPIPEVEDGRIPWQHLRQLVTPWVAYDNDMSAYPPPYTNGPAASLFIGVIPFLLAAFAVIAATCFGRHGRAVRVVWWVCIPLAVVFALGWVTDIYKHVPGFGYFKVPGRYSLVAATGLATLAGFGWDRLVTSGRLRSRGRIFIIGLGAVVTVVTLADLYVYGRRVALTDFVPLTVDEILEDSVLAQFSRSQPQPPRMIAPGNNVLSCTGVANVPGFLGLSPKAYIDETTKIPSTLDPAGPQPGQLDRLRRAGVTHVVFETEFDAVAWQARPWQPTFDAYYTRMMNRFDPNTRQHLPWYIGELTGSRGRVAWLDDSAASPIPTLTVYEPDRVRMETSTKSAQTLVLTDLAYPGWTVSIDDTPAEPLVIEDMLRGVRVPAGEHTVEWRYEPASVTRGWVISLVTSIVILTGLGIVGRRRRVSRDVTAKA